MPKTKTKIVQNTKFVFVNNHQISKHGIPSGVGGITISTKEKLNKVRSAGKYHV